MAHDEEERGFLGDTVRIVPCRPMSKKKRHKLMDIILRPPTATSRTGEGELGNKPAAAVDTASENDRTLNAAAGSASSQ